MYSFITLILLVSLAFCNTVTQTDWSGGDGVQGPVLNWENTFWNTDKTITYTSGKLEISDPIPPIEHYIGEQFNQAYSIYSVDIDGDGDNDVLGAAFADDAITWWENVDGTGMYWTEHTIDGNFDGARDVHSADVDGDGDADVLGAAFWDYDITWWENVGGTGTTWVEHTIVGNFHYPNSIHSVDIDGDGDVDVLGASDWNNKGMLSINSMNLDADLLEASDYGSDVRWWENADGTGTTWIQHYGPGSSCYVNSADVDGDGDIDVLGATFTGDKITWQENVDGKGTSWITHVVDSYFNGAYSAHSGDFDGDGDADILGAAYHDDQIAWWENTDGSGTTWIEHIIDEDFDGARSAYAVDLDGDGDADVLGAGDIENNITWWENLSGTGESWARHTLEGNFTGHNSLFYCDVNGDGYNNVLASSYSYDKISWWNVMSYYPIGILESSILDAGDIDEWNVFLSNSQEPKGTSVSFQFRSSDDSFNMGSWSEIVYSPDTPLVGILADSTRYLQYKVILETSNSGVSPELTEVAFSYTLQVDIGESESGVVPSWSLSITENPSYSFFSALVTVPEAGLVNLSLYDVSGRVVTEVLQELPTGTHSVNFAGIAEGVYFCVMNAENFTSTERIVVLK